MDSRTQVSDIIKNGSPQDKIELLENYDFAGASDEVIEQVCSLIEDEDKGVTNSAAILMITNNQVNFAEYIVEYISVGDITTRNLAGEILVKIGFNSVDPLLDLLKKNNDYDDQKFIIDLLGLIGDQKASIQILDILRSAGDENVKLSCLEALGHLKLEDAVDALMMTYDESDLYKPTIIEALGKIGSQKALDFMTFIFPNEDELTKYSIIESLGLIGDESTFFFLVSELHETTGPLSWIIIKSLQILKEKYGLDIPFDEKMRNSILKTIYDAHPEYKTAAISLISGFSDKEILRACLSSVGESEELDEILRLRVLENPENAISVFPGVLEGDIKNVSKILGLFSELIEVCDTPVNKILNGLSLRSIINSLSNYLSHPDEEARRMATTILFELDPATAVLFSDKMVNDDNLWNKLRLIDFLGQLDIPDADKILEKLSEDSEEMVRTRALDVLSQKSTTYN